MRRLMMICTLRFIRCTCDSNTSKRFIYHAVYTPIYFFSSILPSPLQFTTHLVMLMHNTRPIPPVLRSINLHNRTMVRLPRPNNIVNRTNQRNGTEDQNRIVHIRSRNVRETRPETEEEDKGEVDAGENVVRDTQSARDAPGAPDSAHHAVFCDRGCVEGGAGRQDGAGAAAVEEQRRGEEV
jgi:hypothetical protein